MSTTRSPWVAEWNEDEFEDAREELQDSPDGAQKRNRPGSVEPSPAHKLQQDIVRAKAHGRTGGHSIRQELGPRARYIDLARTWIGSLPFRLPAGLMLRRGHVPQ